MLARIEEQKRQRIAQQEEIRSKVENLSCTVCDGRDFDEQTSREDSQFGMTTFRMRLLVCKQCGFVMQFSLGRSSVRARRQQLCLPDDSWGSRESSDLTAAPMSTTRRCRRGCRAR